MDRCEGCSFVYDAVPVEQIAPELRTLPARYAVQLRRAADDGIERTRSSPDVWSMVEYAGHVRDVMTVQRERLQLALDEDQPVFEPMDRELLVVERRDLDQRVGVVIEELEAAVTALADTFQLLTDEQWHRTGVVSWLPSGARSMGWLGRDAVHEGVHHLGDIVDIGARLRTARR